MPSEAPADERERRPSHGELLSGTAWYGSVRDSQPAGTMSPDPERRRKSTNRKS